jgi:acetyl esterase/lipase
MFPGMNPAMLELFRSFNARLERNVIYGTSLSELGKVENRLLDIYLPADETAAPYPILLWFHGGGFGMPNDKSQIYIWLLSEYFASKGYACISADYRLRRNPRADMAGAVRDAVDDGRMALEWIQAHGSEYSVDTSRLAIGGGSAGGILVANLIHDPERSLVRDAAAAVLSLWGPPFSPESRSFETVAADAPPALLLHGTEDPLIPFPASEAFAAELTEAGLDAQLVPIDKGGHPPMEHMLQVFQAVETFLGVKMPVG